MGTQSWSGYQLFLLLLLLLHVVVAVVDLDLRAHGGVVGAAGVSGAVVHTVSHKELGAVVWCKDNYVLTH